MFKGNYDRFTVVKNKLHKPIITRYIRIRPETWHAYISLRAEFYGCKEGSRYETYHFLLPKGAGVSEDFGCVTMKKPKKPPDPPVKYSGPPR